MLTMLLGCCIALLIALLIIPILTWYYQYYKFQSGYSRYKSPQPIPIVGTLYRMRSCTDVIPVLERYMKRYGRTISMWYGFRPQLVIGEYRTAELLLQSNTTIDKYDNYRYLYPWLGNGLLTSSGSNWRKQRKLITPAFHFKILEQYIGIFDDQTNILINTLQKHTDGQPFDIAPIISLCTLDIICETAMGIQIRAQEGNAFYYVDAVNEMTEIFLTRATSFLKDFDCIFKLTKDYRRQKAALNSLHNQTNYVIDSRIKELNTLGSTKNKKRLAFLDLLILSTMDGVQLSRETIREEVDTFMFEGHDTTTSAICSILYCLSQNLDIQEKVANELEAILKSDTSIAYVHLNEMKYLEMVIKESLRLFPPVPAFARTLESDTEFDGAIFSKGSTFLLLNYMVHRQPDVFPNPENFDPERFAPENVRKRSPFSYIPFSAGPRNCIGQRFAMFEMKTMIAKIVRRFEVLPALGFKPILVPFITLRSINGIFLVLKERKFVKTN